MASELQSFILKKLDESSTPLNSATAFPALDSPTVKGILDSLSSREMLTYETLEKEEAVLTPEGQQISEEGSHEAKVFEAVKAMGSLAIKELAV